MQCYQHCANQAKVQSGLAGGLVDWLLVLRCWFAGCWLCTQLQINTRTRDVVHTKKLLSTLNLVELMCCLCIENTARISMALGFSFNFNVQLTTSRSLSRSTFSFVILLLALSFSLAGLFSKLIVNSFYVVFFRI